MRAIINRSIIVLILCLLPLGSTTAMVSSGSALSIQQERRSLVDKLLPIIEESGVKPAIELYYTLRAEHSDLFDFSENQLNTLGYRLLNCDRLRDAIEIFKLNVKIYPDAHNPADSLAEAYLRAQELELAEQFYNKALELNPGYYASVNGLETIFNKRHYSKHEFRIPMRDGKKLYTLIYIPKDTTRDYPIMMKRTPYSISPYENDLMSAFLGPSFHFAHEGFIFVFQDVRGKYMSEGEWIDMRPYIPNKTGPNDVDETTDTFDTIEWLLANIPRNNGRVGMWGISYPGFYASMALIDAHPALVAVSPQAPVADMFAGDDWHHNGALYMFQSISWLGSNGRARPEPTTSHPDSLFNYPSPDAYRFLLDAGSASNFNNLYFKDEIAHWNDIITHGTYDDFWKSRSILPHLNDVKPAVMVVGGWFDAEDIFGPLKTYYSIESKNPVNNSKIIMGPWYHGGWSNTVSPDRLGDVMVMSGTTGKYYRQFIELPFFVHHLKDGDDPGLPEATIFFTGENEWRQFDAWPPENAEEMSLFFGSDNKLLTSRLEDDDENMFDEYLSDPNKPVPHTAKVRSSWSYSFMHEDQRFLTNRPDVLTYQTEVLEEDLTMAGPIIAQLFVSTTGTDADWIVKIVDVFPDDTPDYNPNPRNVSMGGYQMLLRAEVMRGKFRKSLENPEPFVPGAITEVVIELQDIGHTFKKGHRIMVIVQSSSFPLIDRNPQIFTDIYRAQPEDYQKAMHRIYRSEEFPSRIKAVVMQPEK